MAILLVSGCDLYPYTTPVAQGAAGASDTGKVNVRLDAAGLTASGVVRATMTIGPGTGPTFTPIIAALSQAEGGGWSASVSEIPAGPRRQIDVVAYDSGGIALYRGGQTVDIRPGDPQPVIVLMQQVTVPGNEVIWNPIVSSVAISSGVVVPGGSATLTSTVTDPQGQALSYAWMATCGRFRDPTVPVAVWTAPNMPYQRCQLTFTASNLYASTKVEMTIDVQTDPSTYTVKGERLETCWGDPRPGQVAPAIWTHPAPDTVTVAPPDVLVQASPAVWSRFAGGYLNPSGNFLPASFESDGAFAIPGVTPAPSYVLWFRDSSGVLLLLQTNSLHVDLGYDRPGRCDAVPASAGTSVALQLSQLNSWDTGSSELRTATSGADTALSLASGSQIAQGATSAALTVSWANDALLVPADVLWLQQLSLRTHPSGFVYRSSTLASQVTQVALADGTTTTVATALAPVTQSGTIPIQWSPIVFERSLPDMAPAARVASGIVPAHRLSVTASPFASRYPSPALSGSAPLLATFDLPAQTTAVGFADPLQYGRFLPSWWSERRDVRYAVAVGYQATGAADTHYEVSYVGQQDSLPVAQSNLTPALTPVRNPAINGSSALVDQTLVSLTPTFSWQPPVTGTPSVYELDIYSLQAVAGSSQAQLVARYLTGSTSASLPPGVIASGSTYFARITAIASDVPYLTAPLRYSPVGAQATALTGTFSP